MSSVHHFSPSLSGLMAKGVPSLLPWWLLILRGVILVLSLGALVAAAYNTSLYAHSGPAGFIIFDALFTFIIVGSMLYFERFAPHLYLRIVVFAGLVLLSIFWLSGWAWAASVASDFYGYLGLWHGYGYVNGYGDLGGYGGSMAACAALGGVIWALLLVTLGFFVHACISSPDEMSDAERAAANAELGEVKNEESSKHSGQPPTLPHISPLN